MRNFKKRSDEDYIKQEKNGRRYVHILLNYINHFYDKKISAMEYSYTDYFDMYFVNNNKKIDVEIKIRYDNYDTYYLEQSKINEMKGDKFFYINITPSGTYLFVYEKNKEKEYIRINRNVVRNSTENKGNRDKIFVELYKTNCLFFVPHISTKKSLKQNYDLETNHIEYIRNIVNNIIKEDIKKKKDLEKDIFKGF